MSKWKAIDHHVSTGSACATYKEQRDEALDLLSNAVYGLGWDHNKAKALLSRLRASGLKSEQSVREQVEAQFEKEARCNDVTSSIPLILADAIDRLND